MATIETRTTPDGKTSYRVKIRIRSFPSQSPTGQVFAKLKTLLRKAMARSPENAGANMGNALENHRHTPAPV